MLPEITRAFGGFLGKRTIYLLHCCRKSLSLSKTLENTRPSLPCSLSYLRALWPRDGKDDDALVVEVGEEDTGMPKESFQHEVILSGNILRVSRWVVT